MLPTECSSAKFIGRVGAELDVETGRKAAHLAALNVLAVIQPHAGLPPASKPNLLINSKRTIDVLPNRTT